MKKFILKPFMTATQMISLTAIDLIINIEANRSLGQLKSTQHFRIRD